MPRKRRRHFKMASKSKEAEDEVDMEEVNRWLEAYKPTAEDLARHLHNSELVELCRRVKCRVDAWRWNMVDDHVVKFRSQGRLQQKTPRQALALLSKAVNRHKATAFYTANEIDEQRKSEWGQRKKDNLLRLDLWAYDRREELNKAKPQSGAFEDSIINSEDLPIDDDTVRDVSSASAPSSSFSSQLNTTIISGPSTANSRVLRLSTFSSTQSQSQNGEDVIAINSSESVGEAPLATQYAAVISVHGTESPVATLQAEPSQDNSGHTPLKPTQSTLSTQPSQKSADNMTADFMGLNSESFAFESENIVEIEIPHSGAMDYADFNERISCTSTQSQGIK